MQFNVNVVKDYLLKNDVVYTVRSYKSFRKFQTVSVDDVDYVRERVGKVDTPIDLLKYYRQSGFNSYEDWWNKIVSMGAVGGYMYKVKKLEA